MAVQIETDQRRSLMFYGGKALVFALPLLCRGEAIDGERCEPS